MYSPARSRYLRTENLKLQIYGSVLETDQQRRDSY